MASLAYLADRLNELDVAADGKHILQGISYGLTFNESLGFTGPEDFHVSQPYKPWPEDLSKAETSFESPLAIALKDVLERGIAASTTTTGHFFIDMTSLAGGWSGYFSGTHTGADPNQDDLATVFGKLVNTIPKEVTPVIRILLGMRGRPKGDWQRELEGDFRNLFWKNGNCILHPKAEVYVGFYSPSFQATLDPNWVVDPAPAFDSLIQLIRGMIGKVRDSLKTIDVTGDIEKAVNDALTKMGTDTAIKKLAQATIPSISWNHAKAVAVDGQTSMTGGGIFFPLYMDGHYPISDLQSKVKGEAAISTHAYCDYFWRYLNRDHRTDTDSFRMHASASAADGPKWDTTETAPLFAQEPTHKPSPSASKLVLTVAKLGDWYGDMDELEYPVQIIDAVRDLILNVTYHVIMAKAGSLGPMIINGNFEMTLMPAISDKSMLTSFQAAKVAPTAWASRIARCEAIAGAQSSVIIDAESIACFLHLRESDWKDQGEPYLKYINEQLGLNASNGWEGVTWPYDLLKAIGKFMASIKDDEIGQKEVRILLSAPIWAKYKHPYEDDLQGWQDGARAYELKRRIGILQLGGIAEEPAELDKWFDSRCKIKRTSNDGTRVNHCKVTSVDDKLLYVGSDNAYPNYNEEHGIWIEDKDAIHYWRWMNFERRWLQAADADLSKDAQFM